MIKTYVNVFDANGSGARAYGQNIEPDSKQRPQNELAQSCA